ncbi:SHPS1 phosphatase, partial [Prunella fulvescens]|nr:SHPS1 phosphatase [Prunella fulvescens]
GAQAGQGFSLQQPQHKVSVALGETLTLNCTTSGIAGPGPVKWLKGWGSENTTIYEQSNPDPSSRVTRAVNGSDRDFTIHIRNFQPDDVGTYYCVKFIKGLSGHDEVFQRGHGTKVTVQEASLVPGIAAAAVVLCLILLLCLFIALCVYRKKHRSRVGSPRPARTGAMGRFSSVLLQCCAGTPGTQSSIPHLCSLLQQSSKEKNIHYANLQPLPLAPQRGRSPGRAPTEYASLRLPAK